MYQSLQRIAEPDSAAVQDPARLLVRARFGMSPSLALALVFLQCACSSDGRPPAPGNPGGAGTSNGSAGSAGAQDGLGGNAGASGSAGAGGASGDGSGGSGLAGSGTGGPTSLRDDCTVTSACQSYCDALGPDPSCGVGTAAQCGCLCEDRFNDPCPQKLAALLECVSTSSASGDCRAQGRVIAGCEAESIDLELCDLGGREQLCGRDSPLCEPYCRATSLSFCSQASESVGQCLCGCELNIADRCDAELAAFMTCSASAPEFSCGAEGELLPASCAAEWQTLQVCVRGEAPDAG
jgi:hypothetical protein